MMALNTAFTEATPLVMLIGHVERKDVGRLALQEQNYSRLLSDITKGVFEVIEPIQASETIARAFHLAESGTPGPVAVILPEDIFDAPAEGPVVKPRAMPMAGPRAEALDQLAEFLANAERPPVPVGGALAPQGQESFGECDPLRGAGGAVQTGGSAGGALRSPKLLPRRWKAAPMPAAGSEKRLSSRPSPSRRAASCVDSARLEMASRVMKAS